MYSDRLTRAYLGASNEDRLKDDSPSLTEPVWGDDEDLARSWPPPENKGTFLHLINETIDGRWLLYIKPTLTGDEPADLIEYHKNHAAFPHESTLDQFFDEAQWESYRKLGQHISEKILGFTDLRSGARSIPGSRRTKSQISPSSLWPTVGQDRLTVPCTVGR
jgi:hypothetical protein